MDRLKLKDKIYTYYEYATKKEFEQVIVENSHDIFSNKYINKIIDNLKIF